MRRMVAGVWEPLKSLQHRAPETSVFHPVTTKIMHMLGKNVLGNLKAHSMETCDKLQLLQTRIVNLCLDIDQISPDIKVFVNKSLKLCAKCLPQ